MVSRLRPTDEQHAAVTAFASGEDLVIVAGAGTGKTSTLRMLADATSRRGLYLAEPSPYARAGPHGPRRDQSRAGAVPVRAYARAGHLLTCGVVLACACLQWVCGGTGGSLPGPR